MLLLEYKIKEVNPMKKLTSLILCILMILSTGIMSFTASAADTTPELKPDMLYAHAVNM